MKVFPTASRAFTLVELSVVLVILGLLVGGIMGGQSMIKAAKLRSVAADANAYINAIGTFRSQYRYLPGDMPTAANYWAATTNGDADGLINIGGNEPYTFWQQLNLAGLVDVAYTGAAVAPNFQIGVNVPVSRVEFAGFSAFYDATLASTNLNKAYVVTYGNVLAFGAANGANPPYAAILIPEDAYNIDMKVTDGIPGTGKWLASSIGAGNFGAATGCSTVAGDGYTVSNTAVSCSFFILTGY